MKTLSSQSIRISLCTLVFMALSCHYRIDPSNLYGFTRGYWEWVSTTTPRGTITPQTVGYTKQMVVAIDDNPRGQGSINYVAFYKNDTLQHRYNETIVQQYIADYGANTIIVKYDSVGDLKSYITPNSNIMQISEFLNPYSEAADTIRSVYINTPALKSSLKLPVK